MTAASDNVDDLDSGEIRSRNDALLAQLDEAKMTQKPMTQAELLQQPRVSALVNELIANNEAWIATCIRRNIRRHRHLRGFTVEELYSTALFGQSVADGTVSGVMNAILKYDYPRFGTTNFTHYLSQAIHNALQPTAAQKKAYQRVYSRMRQEPLAEAEPGCADRRQKSPPVDAIDHELLAVVQSVIPRLPKPRQRSTAAWMVEHILATGERPTTLEMARVQGVTHQRASQIMEETINSLRRQIAADYPQLAEDGVGGWEEFKKVFTRPSPASHAR
jgi:hypothetical protein